MDEPHPGKTTFVIMVSPLPVQPKVKVSPTKSGSQPHPHLLVCSVTGFYPGGIEIKWLKNGQEQTAGVVSTELLQNGDWTFQILVMLEMSPRRGDVYTCQVEHISLREPLAVHWDPFVTQGSLGCELHPNGTSRGFCDAVVNGEDFISFDVDTGKWVARHRDKLGSYVQDLVNRDKSISVDSLQGAHGVKQGADGYKVRFHEVMVLFKHSKRHQKVTKQNVPRIQPRISGVSLPGPEDTLLLSTKAAAMLGRPCKGFSPVRRFPAVNLLQKQRSLCAHCSGRLLPGQQSLELSRHAQLPSDPFPPSQPPSSPDNCTPGRQTARTGLPTERISPPVSERPVAVVFARAPPPAGTPAPVLLVCRVTGFYPRSVRVAWLQDGEEVGPGGRLNSSGILPNADLTYQLRSSLAVGPGAGHSYACRVQHSSLGGRSLLIPWEQSRPWGPGLAVGITLGVVAVAAVAVVLWWSRRR
ncbi:uncharacterized protein LOC135974829 [Chrysemys picta bellii]|uniref:uncharacterized protein LOC135974829 n=1 Tax=Chrysemys picta bellii TaxID=8478 RepID=UPI0032B15D92